MKILGDKFRRMKGTKVKMDTKNKQWWQIETDIECELLNVNH